MMLYDKAITALIFEYEVYFRVVNRGCRVNACPLESACTYDIAA